MRKLIYLVAILLTLALTPKSHTQVRIVTTTARYQNELTYGQCNQRVNAQILKLNELNGTFESPAQVKPEKRLPMLQAMRQELEKMEAICLHYDEEGQ